MALPGQLFYSTQIPACLWFLARRRKRGGAILFIDARKLGRMVDRTHRELTDKDIVRIADIYHAWRTSEDDGYADKMRWLVAELRQQQAEAAKLDAAIEVNLKSLGLIANQEGSQ